jgi:hypothetical protein
MEKSREFGPNLLAHCIQMSDAAACKGSPLL